MKRVREKAFLAPLLSAIVFRRSSMYSMLQYSIRNVHIAQPVIVNNSNSNDIHVGNNMGNNVDNIHQTQHYQIGILNKEEVCAPR